MTSPVARSASTAAILVCAAAATVLMTGGGCQRSERHDGARAAITSDQAGPQRRREVDAAATPPATIGTSAHTAEASRTISPSAADGISIIDGPVRAVRAADAGNHDGNDDGTDGGTDGSWAIEQRDSDPQSGTVTIKILVEPPKRAHVLWGVKDFGVAPLQIQRPRGSGPLDLIVRAPGYLTVHTRAFTDRDDHISVRLVPETDASRMLGYRPP